MPYLVMDILGDYPGLPGLFVAAAYSGSLRLSVKHSLCFEQLHLKQVLNVTVVPNRLAQCRPASMHWLQ